LLLFLGKKNHSPFFFSLRPFSKGRKINGEECHIIIGELSM